jgi:hypothetical protein
VRGRLGIICVWLVTRGIVIGYTLTPRGISRATGGKRDIGLYELWTDQIVHGAFPAHDVRWQYPPLAGPVLALARLLPGDYIHGFLTLALAMDLAVLLMLLRFRDHLTGAWVWTVAIFLLGSTVYLRYDLFVTVPAVAALLVLPRYRLFGALASVGALLKIWPALLVLSLPRDRRLLRGGVAFGVVAALILLVSHFFARNMMTFVHNQGGRGMEVEAVAITPFQIARAFFGWHAPVKYRYGSVQLIAPQADTVASLCVFATLIGLMIVAYAAWRRSPAEWTPGLGADIALAAVLVSVITSRVLSPQYLVWLIGLGAVCLVRADTRMRLPVLLIVLAAPLTFYNFPWQWGGFLRAHTLPTLLFVLRNTLLVAATVLAVVRIWPSGQRRPPSSSTQSRQTVSNA